MEPMTLREAAQRSSRSITTLRRYIRSGRLHAEKRQGRFGPEYFVTVRDLTDAGLDPENGARPGAIATRGAGPERAPTLPVQRERERLVPDNVPLALYEDLQMKHEQLLVQYGMVRAGGLRVMELQTELEKRQRRLEDAESESQRMRERHGREIAEFRKRLETARHELEGRSLEIAALQEKVKALEMMTRNAVTNETIEKQFRQIQDQARRVQEMKSRRKWTTGERTAVRRPPGTDTPDH
jgi:hypothetical protein